MQERKHKRLGDEERELISNGVAQKKTICAISNELGREPSTISREIKRNSSKTNYLSFADNRKSKEKAASRKKGKRKLENNDKLKQHVIEKLKQAWSPQEINHRFTIDTDIQAFFAHSGCPRERGTNENTNGLIRQFFPKGTDFIEVSAERINEVQNLLNDRPRAVLGYLKPDEVINKLVALKV